jgi:hypothetical protein
LAKSGQAMAVKAGRRRLKSGRVRSRHRQIDRHKLHDIGSREQARTYADEWCSDADPAQSFSVQSFEDVDEHL